MKLSTAMVLLGAMMTVASAWIPMLEQWGPLLLLWTAGGAHLAWVVAREAKDVGRLDTKHRPAA
jgi:hypothetical protein